MTFEEFFTKKKIDLVQLEKAEPALYSELSDHFASMGEKSFDHTKKFWFNKLRRIYHLVPPDKADSKVETAIASQAEPLSSPTIQQKPAFAPRFKNVNKTEAANELTESKAATKPAFKPRNIPAKQPGQEKTPDESLEALPVKKPAFRPRNFQPADPNAADSNRSDSPAGQPEVSEMPVTDPAKKVEPTREGYKPKFKLKNVARSPLATEEKNEQDAKDDLKPESHSETRASSSDNTENKIPEKEIPNGDQELKESENNNAEQQLKPSYKPKFNLKNIRPKSEE